MATITPPSPLEILDHANVTPAMLGKEDEQAVMVDIGNLLLPGIMARMELAIDEAAAPYNYPFTPAQMDSAYPDDSALQRTERAEKQAALLKLAALHFGAQMLHLRVRRAQNVSYSSETSADKAVEFERLGNEMLAAAIKSIYIVSQAGYSDSATAITARRLAEQEARFAVTSIPTETNFYIY